MKPYFQAFLVFFALSWIIVFIFYGGPGTHQMSADPESPIEWWERVGHKYRTLDDVLGTGDFHTHPRLIK